MGTFFSDGRVLSCSEESLPKSMGFILTTYDGTRTDLSQSFLNSMRDASLPLLGIVSQFLSDGFPIQVCTPPVLVVGEYLSMVAASNGVTPDLPAEKSILTLRRVPPYFSLEEKELFHFLEDEGFPFLGKEVMLVDACMVFDRMLKRVFAGLLIMHTNNVLTGLVQYFVIREIGVSPIVRFDMLTLFKPLGAEEKWDMAMPCYGISRDGCKDSILRDGCKVFDGMALRNIANSGRNWPMFAEAVDFDFCICSGVNWKADGGMLTKKRYQYADAMFEGLWISARLSMKLKRSIDILLADNHGDMYSRCCREQPARAVECRESSSGVVVTTSVHLSDTMVVPKECQHWDIVLWELLKFGLRSRGAPGPLEGLPLIGKHSPIKMGLVFIQGLKGIYGMVEMNRSQCIFAGLLLRSPNSEGIELVFSSDLWSFLWDNRLVLFIKEVGLQSRFGSNITGEDCKGQDSPVLDFSAEAGSGFNDRMVGIMFRQGVSLCIVAHGFRNVFALFVGSEFSTLETVIGVVNNEDFGTNSVWSRFVSIWLDSLLLVIHFQRIIMTCQDYGTEEMVHVRGLTLVVVILVDSKDVEISIRFIQDVRVLNDWRLCFEITDFVECGIVGLDVAAAVLFTAISKVVAVYKIGTETCYHGKVLWNGLVNAVGRIVSLMSTEFGVFKNKTCCDVCGWDPCCRYRIFSTCLDHPDGVSCFHMMNTSSNLYCAFGIVSWGLACHGLCGRCSKAFGCGACCSCDPGIGDLDLV